MNNDILTNGILIQYDQNAVQRVPFRLKDLLAVEHSEDLELRIYTSNGDTWEEIDYTNSANYRNFYVVGLFVETDSNGPFLKLYISDSIVGVAFNIPKL